MSRHKQDTKRQRRIHKKTLEQLYYEEGLTQAEIAAQLGCSKTFVYQRMKEYGLKTRTQADYVQITLPRDELYELYITQGKTYETIAAHFDCSVHTVRKQMRVYDISARTRAERPLIELPYDELYELYTHQSLGVDVIAARLGYSRNTVLRCLRDHGIPVRPSGTPQRQYVPPQVYASITPDVAYALGLLAADGCLNKNYNQVVLTSTEPEIIALFAGCLQLDPDLEPYVVKRNGKWKPTYMLYFSDPGFRVFLEHIGLSPAKSKTIGPLKIPDQVFSDFIRGVWDGDGCWHIHRKPRRSASHPGYLRGTLTSASPAFLEWIQTTVERIVGLCGHIYGIRLVYYGREAVALGEWLYWAPDIPALSRKRSIWERFSDRSHAPSG